MEGWLHQEPQDRKNCNNSGKEKLQNWQRHVSRIPSQERQLDDFDAQQLKEFEQPSPSWLVGLPPLPLSPTASVSKVPFYSALSPTSFPNQSQ
jgi:hypothetical protein